MEYNNFKQLEDKIVDVKKQTIAIVSADKESIVAVLDKRIRNKLQPIFIGNSHSINGVLTELSENLNDFQIISSSSEEESAAIGVSLIAKHKADILMKGNIQTSDFLRAVVNKTTGILKGNTLSHIVVNEVSSYHKLLITSDGGMIPEPDLNQKIDITLNALNFSKKLGYAKPKIAVLSAAETVKSKVKDSLEASLVCEHFKEHYFNDCDIAGPISLDLAMDKKVAVKKKYENAVAGDADIFIGPNMDAMNILGKSIVTIGQGTMAGIVWGASAPIVMTSRGSTSEEKLYSIIISMIVSDNK